MGTKDELYPLLRLAANLLLTTIGACGMWTASVVLPAVQADFGVSRADASLPFTLLMIGFGIGSVLAGRLADRYGVMVPSLIGAVSLAAGFGLASLATSLAVYALIFGLLIGLMGISAQFAPLMTDTSMWFTKRRGIAVAICASGNYVGGAIWPSVIEHFVQTAGWRPTFQGMGLFCLLTMLPLALVLRRRPPPQAMPVAPAGAATVGGVALPFGLKASTAQILMCVAGVSCCVAMSMPQVHIVAYCGDLGYGVAQGAQMLSVMLAFGVVSRLVFGLISDRIGGMRTVLISSTLQMVALLIYLPFDSLASLYVASALFGLFQGGIIPAYAIVIREQFPPQEAGTRVGLTLTATMVGMALGGWLSGAIFDLTGSYHAAFAHGAAWNLLNVIIMAWLFRRTLGPRPPTTRLTPETAR
jgi:MFS family permease